MLFGETGRAPAVNMKPLYELWDRVHIEEMTICGWWNTSMLGCPAHTSDMELVPLTTYHCDTCGESGGPAAMFSVASFATNIVNVTLIIDWERLGLNSSESVLTAPAVAGFQASRVFEPGAAVPVVPSQGWLLVVMKQSPPPLPPPPPPTPMCQSLVETDFTGHDLAPACAAHATSSADCCHQCMNTTACKAWTYISSSRVCCLKTSSLGRRSLSGHESGCITTDCSAPPPPPPPPPPSPPPTVIGTPLLPGWAPTYNMSLSTAIEPCNYSSTGFDLDFASKFGYVDWDWSNGKEHWANERPMSCEENLRQTPEATHARNPHARIFVYRNLVKALPWFSSVRKKLDDPAFAGFFLPFGSSTPHVPRCDNVTGKCSLYYHDQLQTPGFNRLNDRDGLNGGNCTRGGCDCGANPCGEYLWDHRNGSMLRDFLVNEVIGGPNGVDNPAISGINVDDYWNWNGHPQGGYPNGPSEVDPHAMADTGLAPADMEAMHKEWQRTMVAVEQKLIQAKAFQAEWFNCPITPNASTYCWGGVMLPPLTADLQGCDLACQKAQCTAHMRRHCRPSNESVIHKLAWQYIFTKFNSAQPLMAGGQLPFLEQDLARFLLLRGEYAWLGFSWQAPYCGDAYARPPQLDWDFGVPVSECAEVSPEVFERRWSKANVSLDCKAFLASIER